MKSLLKNKKGIDTRAINIIIVIPLLLIAIIVFYKWGNNKLVQKDIAVIYDQLETLEYEPLFVQFMQQHGKDLYTASYDDVNKWLIDTFDDKYKIVGLLSTDIGVAPFDTCEKDIRLVNIVCSIRISKTGEISPTETPIVSKSYKAYVIPEGKIRIAEGSTIQTVEGKIVEVELYVHRYG